MEEQDDKVVDNTLPGWGSWAGEGVTKRKGGRKFLTKIEGVKKGDRQDAKLEKVIINEKKVKKVCSPVPLIPHTSPLDNITHLSRSIPISPHPSFKTPETNKDTRTTSTSPPSSRTPTSPRSSTRAPSACPSARTSSPRRRSSRGRSRASSSSRASSRPCRGLWFKVRAGLLCVQFAGFARSVGVGLWVPGQVWVVLF